MKDIIIGIDKTPLLELQKDMKDKSILKGVHVATLTIGKTKKKIKAK